MDIVEGGNATLWFCRAAEMVSAIERSFERHGAFLAARPGDAG